MEAGVGVPAADWSPDAGIPSCLAPWRRLPDGTCEPVFPDNCTAEQVYPDLGALPAGARVIHVREGTTVSPPDGSEGAPFPSITLALGVLMGETWIRIGPGTYRENLTLRGRVHLAGCRRRVVLTGALSTTATILSSTSGSQSEIIGMSIQGSGIGVGALSGGHVVLRDSDLVDNHGFAVSAQGEDLFHASSRVDLIGCTVRGTLPFFDGTGSSSGLDAEQGGAVTAVRTLIDSNQGGGATSKTSSRGGVPSRIELNDCVVRNTLPVQSDLSRGRGLDAENGAEITARRTLITGNRQAGVFSVLTGLRRVPSHIDLNECVVQDTLQRQRDRTEGAGLDAEEGGVITASRTLIRRNTTKGVSSASNNSGEALSRVELTDCEVSDTLPDPGDMGGGYGVIAQQGGVVTVRRSLVHGNRSAGLISAQLSASGTPAHIEVADCVVRDTLPRQRDQLQGYGVIAYQGGEMTVTRSLILRNGNAGVMSMTTSEGHPSRVDIADCEVRGTEGGMAVEGAGFGLNASDGGRIVASRTLVSRNQKVGVVSGPPGPGGEGSLVELNDCMIVDTVPVPSDQTEGYGLDAERGGTIVAAHTLIRNNRDFGVISGSTSPDGILSHVELTGCAISDTLPNQGNGQAGNGLRALEGGVIIARQTLIQGNREVGAGASGNTAHVGLFDCVIRDTLPRGSDQARGEGVMAYLGGRVTVARTLIQGNQEGGITAISGAPEGISSLVELTDCAVRHTRPSMSQFGLALGAIQGARINAVRVVLEDSPAGGAELSGSGSRMDLEDVLVVDISPINMRGGFGILVAAGAHAEVRRLALIRSQGAAIALLPSTDLRGASGGSSMVLEDAFVRGIGTSSIQYDRCDLSRQIGLPQAFGAIIGASSHLEMRRVVMLDGTTAVAMFGGSLNWSDGSVLGFQRYFVRGTSVQTEPPRVERVAPPALSELAVQDDPMLPDTRIQEPVLDPRNEVLSCMGTQ